MNSDFVSQQPAYEPTARRPIAEIFRRTARGATALCLRLGISADAISYFSVFAAAGAAVCFLASMRQPWLLLVAPFLCFVRLWCNMLDGMVALAAGTASRRGEILNEVPDRISDVVIFVGAAHSGWMHPLAGYWAAILSLVTAYVGTLGQAVGGRREFGGIMSKPWRMVTLGLGAWLIFFFPAVPWLDFACWLVIAGCLQTIVRRLRRILRSLG